MAPLASTAPLELASEVEELYFQAALTRGPAALTLLPVRPGDHEPAERLGYDALLRRARGAAQGLLATGAVRAGAPFLLVAATGLEEVTTFLGGLLVGALPVPISPPTGLVGLEGWVARVVGAARALGATAVVGGAGTLELLAAHGVDLPLVAAGAFPLDGAPVEGTPAAGAYVQLTSGSTADPKGVRIGHRHVAANVHMIGFGSEVRPGDRVCSWLPLYHDMGLVGTLLFSLYWNLDLVLLPPQAFLTRPARWLQAISRHGCTLSPAPAFAFPYVAHRARDEDVAGLDLSAWRVAYCGAEPIHPRAIERFTDRFAAQGLSRGTIFPCYGLAEATLAVTFAPPGRGVREVAASRRRLAADGLVAPPESDADRLELVLNGRPLPELAVEVRDDDGRPVAPGRTGAVFVRGASVADGYHGAPEATRAAFGQDGWLDTGDLGAIVEGELVVIGRRKDLIIVRGRNHAAIDIEWAAQAVEGVRPGSAAAFAVADAHEGTEGAALAAEVSPDETEWSRAAIGLAVQQAVLVHTGLLLKAVVLLPPGTIPKTTSGKVQRARVKALHEAGELR